MRRSIGLRVLLGCKVNQTNQNGINRIALRAVSSVPKAVEESDGKPKSTRLEHTPDPFGIENDLQDASTSSLLVQGNYNFPTEELTDSVARSDTNSSTEPSRTERLAMYDKWLRQKSEGKNKQRFYDEENAIDVHNEEKIRPSREGLVRLDSDNIVTQDGQFDNLSQEYIAYKEKKMASNEKNLTEETSTEKRKKITALEFLKKHKSAEKPITTKLRAKKIPTVSSNYSSEETVSDKDLEYLDSNQIPKHYKLPNYNQITEDDMWNVLKSQIIFQNDFLVAINKPFGVPMHSPAIDCRHYIIKFLPRLAEYCSVSEIHPLHRLDRETTGVLLFAKNEKMSAIIRQKFADRQIQKTYLAITKLCPQYDDGVIKIPIGEGIVAGSNKYRSVLKPDLRAYKIPTSQKNCRYAETHFKVISSIKEAAFLEVSPVTGVKHQIRVHLGLGLGCPVLGDHKYSHRDKMAPQRLPPQLLHRLKLKQSKVRELPMHLHCSKISFSLADEKEPVFVHTRPPNYFMHTLRALRIKN